MKKNRSFVLITLFLLASFLLTACGGTAINNYPGVSVNQNMIYTAHQGQIYAINADSGTMAWSFPPKPDASKPFYAAPAVSEDLIVAGNYGHTLYGLDKNGAQRWSYDTRTGNFVGSPLIVGSTVLAPSSNNNLYALSMDGKELWKFGSENMLWAQPASDGEVVYLPALDHNLYALRLSDGSEVWTADLGSALLSAPVLAEDGTLYLSTLDGEVIAVNSQDGSVLWRVDTGGRLWSTPVLGADALYVGNSTGKAVAVSIADGSIQWQSDAGSPIIGGGVLAGDSVAFPAENGSLVAFRLTGERMWNQPINGKLYTTPVVIGDTLVAAAMGGEQLLQAYNLAGQPKWSFAPPK